MIPWEWRQRGRRALNRWAAPKLGLRYCGVGLQDTRESEDHLSLFIFLVFTFLTSFLDTNLLSDT